jgi:Protein of unknown function (DUF3015)
MTSIRRLMLLIGFVAAGLTVGTFAFAEEASKVPGSGPSPYRDCGIGAALFPETNWAAVTSNVIWDLGITAITSATASPQTCSGKTVKAALFIGNTYEELAEETAAGQGEHLTTLLNLFDCDGAHQPGTILEMRAQLARTVAAPDYMNQTRLQKAAQYYSLVERAANHGCSV